MLRKTLILLSLFCCQYFTSCKKTIEQIQEDLVVKAMTEGFWKVSFFSKNGDVITTDFSNYKFKYHKNRTVDAILNEVVEQTGNWEGDAAAKTTWANFPSATDPILLLNGTWNINQNTWTHVKASQTNGSETRIMWLDKL